jgi:hypothetical protein
MQAGSGMTATPSTQSVPAAKPQNRRQCPRYRCEGDAEVFVPHGALLFRGKILDLSFSGCFIEVPALDLERGTPVEVSFSVRQMQFRVAGRIAIMHRRRGAGIAFEALTSRRARQISDLITELKEAAPE